MPRKGYKSTGRNSLPEEIIQAIDNLLDDETFRGEMKLKGITRISRALVIRIAVLEYLERKGVDIKKIFEAVSK